MPNAVGASVHHGPGRSSTVSAFLRHILVLAATLTATAQTPAPLLQSDESHTVRGTVINEVTGAPIARALVYTPGNRFAMLTDGEGHFEFDLPKRESATGPESQRYTFGPTVVMARKPGYLDDPNFRNQVEATPGTEITLPLLPEGLIKGRVIFSEADPAPGATVQLYSRRVEEGMPRWVQAGAIRANSNGEFRFAELQPGSYQVGTDELPDNDPATRVRGGKEYGYPPVYYPGVSDFAAAGTIQLTAGETVQADIPLTRQPYYPVKIPVANNDPLNNNLEVTVSVQGHRGPGYSLGFNPENQVIEGSLPRGEYLVEAASRRGNASSGSVHLSVAGAPAQGPTLTLTPNSSIPVHVVEEFTSNDWAGSVVFGTTGRPVPLHGPRLYLQVVAEPVDAFTRGGFGLRPPSGPNDDTLVIENLEPGRYWLNLHSGRGYVASATMGGVDLLHEPFTVSPGTSTPIEITMRDDAAEIDGTVAGIGATPDNSPHAGGFTLSAYVYCVPAPDSPGQYLELTASSDGKVDYRMVAPGTYRVLAFKNPQQNLPYRDPEAMKAFDSKGQLIHFSAGQKTTVQLQVISTNE